MVGAHTCSAHLSSSLFSFANQRLKSGSPLIGLRVAGGIRTVSILEPRATSNALVGPAGLFTFAQMHLRVGGWPNLAFCGCPTQAAFAWGGVVLFIHPIHESATRLTHFPIERCEVKSKSPSKQHQLGWGTLMMIGWATRRLVRGRCCHVPPAQFSTSLHSDGKTTSKSRDQTSSLRLRRRARERVDQNRFVEILILSDRQSMFVRR